MNAKKYSTASEPYGQAASSACRASTLLPICLLLEGKLSLGLEHDMVRLDGCHVTALRQ
jgi:hypothetical protein